jgi:hypothetical protein
MERILLAAICGAALVMGLGGSSPPQQRAGIQQQDAGNEHSEPLPPATTPPPLASPQTADKGCQDRKDDRSSDLCAQWKAADSAYEGAVWTRRTGIFTGIGLFVGLVTMGAAIGAALFAKDAARYARDSVEAGRAWISYSDTIHGSMTGGGIDNVPVANGYILRFRFVNTGETPAKIIRTANAFRLGEPGEKPIAFDVLEENDTLHPAFLPKGGGTISDFVLNDAQAVEFRERRAWVYCYVVMEYEDIFSTVRGTAKKHVTECHFSVRHYGGTIQQNDVEIESLGFQQTGPQNNMT